MAGNEDTRKFVKKVIEMRRIQREFFKTRSYATMQLAKSLEKDVDDRAKKLLAFLDGEGNEAAQGDSRRRDSERGVPHGGRRR